MSTAQASPRVWGLMAEFETVEQVLEAAERTREAGYTRWDAHTPFPVHHLPGAMGLRETRLPWAVLVCGLVGAFAGLAMQVWMNAIDYPLNISGKPLFSIPANIPIAFETTILLSALGAFVGMLVANGLPQLFHPALKSERFRRVTQDRFFIVIERRDPLFDVDKTHDFLASLSGGEVERLEE
jgi:hypothetical protein